MSPEDRPPQTGPLLVLTLCVAALTAVLWIDWVSSRDQGLFTASSDALTVADSGPAAGGPPGR